jgi:hypothetical protein
MATNNATSPTKRMSVRRPFRATPLVSTTVVLFAIAVGIIASSKDSVSFLPTLSWSIAQWTLVPSVATTLQQFAWDSWEKQDGNGVVLDIPRISIHDHKDPAKYLEATYGKNWRDKPLLLQGLWNASALEDPRRRLSLRGLLKENLTIPYFTDARVYGALSPDGNAPVREIVQRIAQGKPHKIGTQLLVQEYPTLMEEVAPMNLITDLFGNHFDQKHLLGHGSVLGIFPGTTTVPVFVANGVPVGSDAPETTKISNPTSTSKDGPRRPVTGLHCEPIGNVAVQLSGVKEWTLIDPEHFSKLNPALAADGRAFFASWATSLDHVPRYKVKTFAGDAVWVPTWTWHRVDYIESDDVSIGGSLFHFRPADFIWRNPLYALLIVPAMLKELAGVSSQ